jgi:hypothetical protein
MHITQNQDQDQDCAQDILVALLEIQNTPGMQAEAVAAPESIMDRLGLSGVARHAVAFAITAFALAPSVAQLVHTDAYWNS